MAAHQMRRVRELAREVNETFLINETICMVYLAVHEIIPMGIARYNLLLTSTRLIVYCARCFTPERIRQMRLSMLCENRERIKNGCNFTQCFVVVL